MMNKSLLFFSLMAAIILSAITACHRPASDAQEAIPENFASLGDVAQVQFMMKNASPDSVARFICDAALGKVPNARIDTIGVAVAYAYTQYNDSNLVVFSREFDDYSANLPLDEKMKIYALTGKSDPQGLGYELGLEYVNHIRESRMTVAQIKEELYHFKQACANDSDTYRRFMKGFKTVLHLDHGKDLPEEIYTTFIDY